MTSVYTRLVETGYQVLSKVTPLDAWSHFQALQNSQWLSADEVRDLQWRKLQALLEHSYENIPFYRRIWSEAGVDPRRFSSAADMHDLPTVDKPALIDGQENNEFGLEERPDLELVHTSGTTGPRFYVPFTLADFQKKYASHLRQMYSSGWRLGMKSASLYYSGHPQFEGKYTGMGEQDSFVNIRKLALPLAHRRMSLTPYHEAVSGNDSFCKEWYEKLARYKPVLLETMEFNLPYLMDYIEREKLAPLEIPIIYLLGTLTDRQRDRYRTFFKAEVFDRFSPHEMEGIAFACHEHRGMHIASESFLVEFVDDEHRPVAAGELGQITITDLENLTMPLIRYRVGDVGHYYDEPCPCGRGLPLMAEIGGRTRDVVRIGERRAAPAQTNAVLQDQDDVVLFQIRQVSGHEIEVDIVPKEQADKESLSQVVQAGLRQILGPEAEIRVTYVKGVPLEANGKVCLTRGLIEDAA